MYFIVAFTSDADTFHILGKYSSYHDALKRACDEHRSAPNLDFVIFLDVENYFCVFAD